MERVISRLELRSRSPSSATSSDDIAIEESTHLEQFDIVRPEPALDTLDVPDENVSEDAELDFRLFGSSKPIDKAREDVGVHKILLQDPTIDSSNAGFIQPNRDPTFYFTNPLKSSVREDLQSVALSGEQIEMLAKLPWPGSAYSWKVLSLPLSSLQKSLRIQTVKSFQKLAEDAPPTTRKRPGKKYRIKLRQRNAALKAQTAASEAAGREKRTRQNREKKAKKRARDKAKKAAAADIETGSQSDEAE